MSNSKVNTIIPREGICKEDLRVRDVSYIPKSTFS
jgi:hypothetical protein